MKLNKYGVNACIKAHLLPDKEMRKVGFTDYREGYWYFCRDLGHEISFNVTINKNDVEDLCIDVLDEDFCQPYDYQKMIRGYRHPNKIALITNDKVEDWMDYLQSNGVLSGHVKGEYI